MAEGSRSERGRRWSVMVGSIQDHPAAVSLVLLLLVVGHSLTALKWTWLNPYKSFSYTVNDSISVTIFLGGAAASAIVAGFAGVVLIFAIGSTAPRVRKFRTDAGVRLHSTWITVVIEPFIATVFSIIAAVTQLTAGKQAAPWFFEGAIVLLVHGFIRLGWVLWQLIQIVSADDSVAAEKEGKMSVEDVLPNARRN